MTGRTAYDALVSGDCALIATDTVYGLAALPGSDGEKRIYELKRRPHDQMLPWLVSGEEMLAELASELQPYALELVRAFWPGALTVVVATPGSTRALRCPASAECLDLIERLHSPLACTSANEHGQPTPRCKTDLPARIRAVDGYDELPAACGLVASTIIDCTQKAPRVLREGALPVGSIWDVAGLDDTLSE